MKRNNFFVLVFLSAFAEKGENYISRVFSCWQLNAGRNSIYIESNCQIARGVQYRVKFLWRENLNLWFYRLHFFENTCKSIKWTLPTCLTHFWLRKKQCKVSLLQIGIRTIKRAISTIRIFLFQMKQQNLLQTMKVI